MKQMRRALAILLTMYFGLGPLAAALPGSDDASLPPCCRRHGAHHCAMAMRMAAMMAEARSGSTPFVTAHSTCPLFPGFAAGPSAPAHALAATTVEFPSLLEQAHAPAAVSTRVHASAIRIHAGRAPPQTS
jgi:hypothetical protein